MAERSGDFGNIRELRTKELRLEKYKTASGANVTALKDWPSLLQIEPTGANRDLTMPAEADVEGKVWIIINGAAATHALVVKDDAGNTIQSVAATKAVMAVVIDGAWKVFSLLA